MIRKKIPAALRLSVADRSGFRCEYCRLPEVLGIYPFEVDHIVAIRHGGSTTIDNLAYCCLRCNRQKGTDLTTHLPGTEQIVRLYHPRKDVWNEHFEVVEGAIYGKTDIGEATAWLLTFNTPERVIGRKLLVESGMFD